MREIKFRAWNKRKKQMLEVREITFLVDEGSPICIEAWEPDAKEKSNAYLVTFTPGDFELMQYTGLTDKNGKEIYEGYIVKSEWGGIGEVVFEDGAFISKWESGKVSYRLCESDIVDRQLEVIGNVYEHPELLV